MSSASTAACSDHIETEEEKPDRRDRAFSLWGVRPLWKLAAVVAAVVAVAGSARAQPAGALPDPDLPSPDTSFGHVIYDLLLQDLDGARFPLSRFEGEVLFVNFWASWCRPCLEEMPGIQQLRARLKGRDVAFLLISTDEQMSDVEAFLSRLGGSDWPVYLRTWKFGRSTFRRIGIPASFIVDRSGKIVYRHVGAADWDSTPIVEFLVALSEE